MTTRRKLWRTPVVRAKSVSEALGSGETAGPMAPGLVVGPPPKFGSAFADSVKGPPPGPFGAGFGPAGPPPGPIGVFAWTHPIAIGVSPNSIASLDGPPVPSDIRLKEDIAPVGESAAGFPLYTFRYRGQQGIYQGVMAQDVVKTRPDAVIVDKDGFYMVDYGKLGIEFQRIQ